MVHLIVHEITDIITDNATGYELIYPLVSGGFMSVLRDTSIAKILEHIKKYGWSETWYIRKDKIASEKQSSNSRYYQILQDYDGTLSLKKQHLVSKTGVFVTEDGISIIAKYW